MPDTVYRKTDAGRLAVAHRSGELAGAARHVLILVNGTNSAAHIATLGVPDLAQHLQTLLQRGFIEPVPAPAPTPHTSTPAPPVATPDAARDDELPDRAGLQRRALQLLVQHFGPDTPQVIGPLLLASGRRAAQEALVDIEARLAIYLGKRQAARELQALHDALQEPAPTMAQPPSTDRS